MKAIVARRYGGPEVLRLEEIPKPNIAADEVLLEIHAASVNPADWHMLRADPFFVRFMAGLVRPKQRIQGSDAAGRVAAVGRAVTDLSVGDEVFGEILGRGAWAEYAAVPAKALAKKPQRLSFEEAAAVPMAALTALQGVRDHGRVAAGMKVLVNGAGGGVGTFLVQLAKNAGAEVTGVCSTGKVGLVKGLGADHVLDYTKEDYTRGDTQYDVVFDTAVTRPLKEPARAVRRGGKFFLVGGTNRSLFAIMMQGGMLGRRHGIKMGTYLAKSDKNDLTSLARLIDEGRLRPVIGKRFALAEAAEALRYVENGHAEGKTVITVRAGAP